jgi:methionyl-tRNA formyltransferase
VTASLRIVFMGSGAFAIPSLLALEGAGHRIEAVVTQPDRPKGRGRAPSPPPVKPIALERGMRVLQPERIRSPEGQTLIRDLAPDIQVVVAYGQILPTAVIDLAPLGTVNVHGSLLPRWRGAAPVQWAIAEGDLETGVTTMLIDAGLDTGPILLSRRTAILPDETAGDLERRLAEIGGPLVVETLQAIEEKRITPLPQDHTLATRARPLDKSDGRIDWTQSAATIARRIRAFDPWPMAHTTLNGQTIRVLRAREVPPGSNVAPGTVVAIDAEGLTVACAAGSRLLLRTVHPESRKPMPAAAFAAGSRVMAGSRLS